MSLHRKWREWPNRAGQYRRSILDGPACQFFFGHTPTHEVRLSTHTATPDNWVNRRKRKRGLYIQWRRSFAQTMNGEECESTTITRGQTCWVAVSGTSKCSNKPRASSATEIWGHKGSQWASLRSTAYLSSASLLSEGGGRGLLLWWWFLLRGGGIAVTV